MTSVIVTVLNETIDINALMSFFGTVLSTFVSDLAPNLVAIGVFGLVVDWMYRGGDSIIGSFGSFGKAGKRK